LGGEIYRGKPLDIVRADLLFLVPSCCTETCGLNRFHFLAKLVIQVEDVSPRKFVFVSFLSDILFALDYLIRRLRVFENRVLRRIFGPKRDEVTGEWRRLHNEQLNDMYSSLNIVRVIKSRRMRWAGHVARRGEGRGVYRVLVGKPEGKRPLGRPRHRWEDNINL